MYQLTAASWFRRGREGSDRFANRTDVQDELQNKTVLWKNRSDVFLPLGRSTYNCSGRIDTDYRSRNKILFNIEDPTGHYHIPLLISPYSFTTYKGSWGINEMLFTQDDQPYHMCGWARRKICPNEMRCKDAECTIEAWNEERKEW